MINKKLLSRSLSKLYEEMVYMEHTPENKNAIKEIEEAMTSPILFNEYEIELNKKEIEDIELIFKDKEFVCYVDGAVRVHYDDIENNTGKSIIASNAYVIVSESGNVIEDYFPIPTSYDGVDTNSHIAEYQALVSCLRVISIYHPNPQYASILINTDSKNMSHQMNMQMTVRKETMLKLRDEAFSYIKMFKNVEVRYCPRELNKRADQLARKGINQQKGDALL